MTTSAKKPEISLLDYKKLCENFLKERIENYVQIKGISWFDLYNKIDSPQHNREQFRQEIDTVVSPQYHMRNYPLMKNYRIL